MVVVISNNLWSGFGINRCQSRVTFTNFMGKWMVLFFSLIYNFSEGLHETKYLRFSEDRSKRRSLRCASFTRQRFYKISKCIYNFQNLQQEIINLKWFSDLEPKAYFSQISMIKPNSWDNFKISWSGGEDQKCQNCFLIGHVPMIPI